MPASPELNPSPTPERSPIKSSCSPPFQGKRQGAAAAAAKSKGGSSSRGGPEPLDPQRHFYASRILESYATQQPTRVTLRQLVTFGRQLSDDRLLKSANYLRTELPIRLAHRLRDFQTHLPFIAVANPHLSAVYSAYWSSFLQFRDFPVIQNMDDNRIFCDLVRSQLDSHRSVIPRLALGLLECYHGGVLTAPAVDAFMSEMLRSRIGRRVLAQQHLSLTDSYYSPAPPDSAFIGIVNTRTRAMECVHRAADVATALVQQAFPNMPIPPIRLTSLSPSSLSASTTPTSPSSKSKSSSKVKDIEFPYIPDHLEYILLELFKNALVASIQEQQSSVHATTHEDFAIDVTVCAGADHVVFRVSDRGGGVPSNILPSLFSFVRPTNQPAATAPPAAYETSASFTISAADRLQRLAATPYLTATVAEQHHHQLSTPSPVPPPSQPSSPSAAPASGAPPNSMPLRHLGLGAPLAKVYADYWAGSLEVVVLDGHGTDAYLRVPRRGTVVENVQTAISVDAK
ncbi:branched-chain alpha-ketoacid dehydrogenase [Catenaria anguillulae PL171]|uniref:Protein-serine/threonine kinase n=1 Tax=Catenaria anguillulae PL171 TaxID=765915 RepID=A0A1Y2H4N7_9FUNG|nr:branched-chain alpha-ketoacid dehydrogenase [Catenaria anguillulae PL171]